MSIISGGHVCRKDLRKTTENLYLSFEIYQLLSEAPLSISGLVLLLRPTLYDLITSNVLFYSPLDLNVLVSLLFCDVSI